MADYKPTVITKKGFKVLQNVVQGKQLLTFSKMEIGIGQVQNADDIENLESLVDSKITADIVSIKSNDDGSCSVVGSYTNVGMTDSYILNEVGVFVKDENNKDVLYAYSTADGNGDWFGAGSTILKEIIEMIVYISTATSITANITHTVFASEVDMDGTDVRTVIIGMQDGIEKLKTSTTNTTNSLNAHTGNKNNPHGVTKEQIGLGSVVNGALSSSITSTSTTTYANSNAVKLVNDKAVANASDIASLQESNTNGGTALNAHIANKTNPHGVTKEQVGLGNVVNGTLSSSITSTSTTTYANSNAVKLVNDKVTAIENLSTYDLVIKTQSEFNELVNSGFPTGVKSIALVGNFTCNRTFNPPANVIQIDGYNGCTIDFGTLSGNLFLGNASAMPSVSGITVKTNTTGHSYGFYYFNNVTDCVAENSGGKSSYGFYSCNKLSNCIANNRANNSSSTENYGFYLCSELVNCVSNPTYAAESTGFESCNNIVNCVAEGANNTGFRKCKNLNNCHSHIANSVDMWINSFYTCDNLTNCTSNYNYNNNLNAEEAIGFLQCNNLTNCIANDISYGTTYSFSTCNGINNCTANNVGDIYSDGFSHCSYINGAKKGSKFNHTLWSGTITKRDDATCDLS